jgi:ABC-type Zn uptake system ZnuABC Zn-binding protein ZnuA
MAAFEINGLKREELPLPVVATFSILGDFVKNVGGDRVEQPAPDVLTVTEVEERST